MRVMYRLLATKDFSQCRRMSSFVGVSRERDTSAPLRGRRRNEHVEAFHGSLRDLHLR